jgi:hypothetical protein
LAAIVEDDGTSMQELHGLPAEDAVRAALALVRASVPEDAVE